MILQFFFVLTIVLNTFGQSPQYPSSDEYLFGIQKLVPAFNKANAFDEPYSISNARISTPVNIKLASLEQIKYYNYYTASINCPYSVRNLSCFYCDKIIRDIKNFINNKTYCTSAMVALSENREEIVVAFRATENIWNNLLDDMIINATPDAGSNIKIHKGFYIAVMSLYNDVVETILAFRLKDIRYETYKIVITGHSLGASMARLTSFYFMYINQFPGTTIEVYGFGELRSGNKYYTDYMNSQNITTARITSRADIFCHLPPVSVAGTNILFDYYDHVLNEYYVNGNKSIYADETVYEDLNCSNSLGPLYSAEDHFTYLDVDHMECLSEFIQEFSAIPDIINPVEDVPQFPVFVRILITDVSRILHSTLSPNFG